MNRHHHLGKPAVRIRVERQHGNLLALPRAGGFRLDHVVGNLHPVQDFPIQILGILQDVHGIRRDGSSSHLPEWLVGRLVVFLRTYSHSARIHLFRNLAGNIPVGHGFITTEVRRARRVGHVHPAISVLVHE